MARAEPLVTVVQISADLPSATLRGGGSAIASAELDSSVLLIAGATLVLVAALRQRGRGRRKRA